MKRSNEDGLGSEQMTIIPLGAGNEVGRSCIILKFKGKTIMLDCGVHPAYTGLASLPFFDEIDPESIDLILITHFHLDHAAALPYFMEKTSFKGRVYMTHPTKAIYKWMLSDYVKVSNVASSVDEDQLYTDVELSRSYEKILTIDYHQEIEFEGVKFTALNAGHVLGAAMFVIELAGVRILYTGDYSREEDRHLMAAETPRSRPEVMICESTYGVQSHQPRLEREHRFTNVIHDIVRRGGRCLIPVFALGRAQELLLILDEYWKAHPELHQIPVYYASPMANKCMAVYQTYVNMMNENIRRHITISNPFVFKHIKYLKGGREAFKDVGPCVMMASPGMLQNGFSRELFEAWAPHKSNGLLIPGYVVEGTMGKHVLTQPNDIVSLSGQIIPLRMSVEYISFSAHVDFIQNSEFIDLLKPPHLILVHGEQTEMMRLKAALNHKYGAIKGIGDSEAALPLITIHTPKNCESVSLAFAGEKAVKLAGKLAMSTYEKHAEITGILVGKDFDYQVVHPDDLPEYAQAKIFNFTQKQSIISRATLGLLEHILVNLVGRATVTRLEEPRVGFRIKDAFELLLTNPNVYTLSWTGGLLNDLIADSIIAAVCNAEVSPASVKATINKCGHHHTEKPHHEPNSSSIEPDGVLNVMKAYLEGYFGNVKQVDSDLIFFVDDSQVKISTGDFSVECQESNIQDHVSKLVGKITNILDSSILL